MELLNPSTALLLDLYERAPCGFHSLDPEGLIIHINDTELTWLGFSREEIVGQIKWADLLTLEGRGIFEYQFRRFKSEGVVRDLEFDVVRKDGTLLPVLVSATAIIDDRGEFVMSRSIVYDLSHRKLVDQQFRDILDAAPDVMIVCDKNGNITLTNAQVEKVFGYRPEELRGRPVDILVPDRFRSIHPAHRRRFKSDPSIRPMGIGMEVIGRRKDGTEVSVEISLSQVRAQDGLESLAIVRDVTDRRLVEDALAQKRRALSLDDQRHGRGVGRAGMRRCDQRL